MIRGGDIAETEANTSLGVGTLQGQRPTHP